MELKITDARTGVLLSGGLDSLVGLYNLCNEIIRQDKLDTTVIPFHYIDTQYPVTKQIVKDIVRTVKATFPDVTIEDAKMFEYDLDYIVTKSGWKCLNMEERDRKFDDYVVANNVTNVINFITILPEKQVWSKWNLHALNPRELSNTGYVYFGTLLDEVRNTPHEEYEFNGKYTRYNPYATKTKMFVKEMFNLYNVPGRFIDDTRSCTRIMRKPITNHKPTIPGPIFDHPDFDGTAGSCGQCYHCWEKKWAFGKI